MIVGAGSNLLLTKDYPHTVFHSQIKMIQERELKNVANIKADENAVLVDCGSGETFDDVIAWCVERDIHGLENLSLIPGDVGSSAVQNIGAYGVEVGKFIFSIEVVDVNTGEYRRIFPGLCQYGYRHSIFQSNGEAIVEVELEESKGDSVMTLTNSNLKFNKVTAQELGFPAYVKMYIDAPTRRVAIEPCAQSAKNAVPFSKDESKQTYAVVLKVPALLTAARKLADADENSGSLSFNGTLYPKEKVIIFNLSEGKPAKTRKRRKKNQDDAEKATERTEEEKSAKVNSEKE